MMKKALTLLLALTLVASLAACGNTTAGSSSSAAAGSSSAMSSQSASTSSSSSASGSTSATQSGVASNGPDISMEPGVEYDDTLKVQILNTDGSHNYVAEDDSQYLSDFTQTLYFKDDAVVAAINDITVTDAAMQDTTVMQNLEDSFSSSINGGTITTAENHIYVTYTDLSGFTGMTKDALSSSLEASGYQIIAQ